jgi:hypothetical protein
MAPVFHVATVERRTHCLRLFTPTNPLKRYKQNLAIEQKAISIAICVICMFLRDIANLAGLIGVKDAIPSIVKSTQKFKKRRLKTLMQREVEGEEIISPLT